MGCAASNEVQIIEDLNFGGTVPETSRSPHEPCRARGLGEQIAEDVEDILPGTASAQRPTPSRLKLLLPMCVEEDGPAAREVEKERSSAKLRESPMSSASTSASMSSSTSTLASFHATIQLMGSLGRGSFAEVYAGRRRNKGLAIKVCELAKPGCLPGRVSPSGHQYVSPAGVQREVDILLAVSGHANCLTIFGAFAEDGIQYIITEFCSQTSLAFLESRLRLDMTVVRPYFHQVFQGLVHLNSVDVVHRDIKPDNFLISSAKGKDASKPSKHDFVLKLCDFGLSAIRGKHRLTGCYGTAPFMSPEMVETNGHDELTDIWSAGAVMYTFLFGRFPYRPKTPNAAAMKESIRVGAPINYNLTPKDATPRVIAKAVPLLRLLMTRHRSLRPRAEDVLRDGWFTSPTLEDDPYDFSRIFMKARTNGLFDQRNMPMPKALAEPKKTTPLDERLMALQEESFPKTAKFCVQPFAEVMALCKAEQQSQQFPSGGSMQSRASGEPTILGAAGVQIGMTTGSTHRREHTARGNFP